MGFTQGSVLNHLQVYKNDQAFIPDRLPTPTDARPGSPEKIAILCSRLASGQHLYHPEDAQIPSTFEIEEHSTREFTTWRESFFD